MAWLETKLTALTRLALVPPLLKEPTSAKPSTPSRTRFSSAVTQTMSISAIPRMLRASVAQNFYLTLGANPSNTFTEKMVNQQQNESGVPPEETGSGTTSVDWRRVPGYEEFEVTRDGAIRENGGPARLRVAGSGHLYVLRTKSRPALLVHRAVLLAFEGPCPPGHVCRHLNDNPADNRWSDDPTLNNLKWGTKKQNAEDRVRNTPTKPGWTDERRLLELIKHLEEDNSRLRAQNMRLKATVMNFIANRDHRVTESLKKDLGL
jgi:hypothetical protein